jgi:uncharacterized protein
MDGQPVRDHPPALLARRIARLRNARQPAAVAAPASRAADLAAAVGGELVTAPDGTLVTVESIRQLPLARGLLALLPYGLDASGPLFCLDTETTGLGTGSGTLPFLVGIGQWQGGELIVRQYLLPDHSHEPAFLTALAAAIPTDAWLVTYNGRSFDWPLLVSRYRLHRRDPPPIAGHFDLLPVARQLWKHRLGDARLATVEQAICGVARHGDLPGALIPERYFEYLRTRRPALLRDVVEHNCQDIVSLAEVLGVLADELAVDDRWPALHPGDLAGLGRRYLSVGQADVALRCVEAALTSAAWANGVIGGGPLRRRLAVERARLLARLGRRSESADAWLELAQAGGPWAALAWLRVAVHREHVQRDPLAALAACQAARAICERAREWGRPIAAVERDLARRMPRLRRRAMNATSRAEQLSHVA